MIKNIAQNFAIALLLFFIIAGCNAPQETKHPHDPWVFRSVLDKQARMVTAALDHNLYVAYDAKNCQLYKAWKGGVTFDGAVYTTNHGPQPTTKGYAYYTRSEGQEFWYLIVDGKEHEATLHFKGYGLNNDQVTFHFQLSDKEGRTFFVDETPAYYSKGDQPGLKRTFQVSGAPADIQLKIKTQLSNLMNENDYETNGKLKVVASSEERLDAGTTYQASIEVVLNQNGKTELSVLYHPGFEEKPKAKREESGDVLAQGSALIDGSDCKTCHNEKVKTVGPAYVDVAKKYELTEANVRTLVAKVKAGASGNWGAVPMSAHPDLTEEDAARMILYIMSLDGEVLKDRPKENDHGTGTAFVNLTLDEKNDFEKMDDSKDYPGLAIAIYTIENAGINLYDLPKQADPIYTAVAPVIHFNEESFQESPRARENMLLHAKGFITIEKDNDFVFRLTSDDGSRMWLDNKLLVDNDGFHSTQSKEAEISLKKRKHPVEIIFYQGGGGLQLSLQWATHDHAQFTVIDGKVFTHSKSQFKKSTPYVPLSKLVKNIPGDRKDEAGVHPSFKLEQARPSSFKPRVGGMDFLSDGSLIICTWDSLGPVYKLGGVDRHDAEKIKVTRIAAGLAEPLGLKVVNDTIYVLQKQELTRLIDTDHDGIINEYQTVCDGWKVSANFHEFAFGLAYKNGYFYAALATAINPGGASTKPQIPDRGKVIKISKKDGSFEFIAQGLRTPNGINIGVDGELFVTDNQGDWLPASKLLHVTKDSWYGSHSVDPEGTALLTEKPPVVWLPQDEIGNSPSQPIPINLGMYKGQMLHGEVTHGGFKRVFLDKVNGEYQGVVFRFTQGLEGGVNRAVWGPDGALYAGMVGNPGNWNHAGSNWFGLQKLIWTGDPAFEMLAVRAKSNGMEIEMTEPLADAYGNLISDYEIKQWYYKPTENYGGPKLDEKLLAIKSVNISNDRKKIFLEIDGMQANHVLYIRLKGNFISNTNRSLWSTEGWYTLNQIPINTPGFRNPVRPALTNVLTEKEKRDGWKLLFDGKTTTGWRSFKQKYASSVWVVKDGAIALNPSHTGKGGDLMTMDEYENYELNLEWKIEKCGNSGIIFNAIEADKYKYAWQTGLEMQVLDNTCHPDARIEKHRAGDLYDLIESKFVATNGAEQWNHVRLISNKGKYEFWLNGYRVVEFEMHTKAWNDVVAKSKFKDMSDFGKANKGHICLQDHGNKVWYRNIKIKELVETQ